MAFKMKAGSEGPMKKNFGSAAKQKVEVFGGRATIDVGTEAGKKLLKEIKSIPTVSSSDPGRVTKSASSKVKNILSKHAGKLLDLGVKSSVILSMFDPVSAGKGSTTLDKDKYDLTKNIKD